MMISLMVKETGVPGKKLPTCCKSLTNFTRLCCVSSIPWAGFELTLVVIGTDYTDSCKSNNHMIMTMKAPDGQKKWQMTINDLQNTTPKTKDWATRILLKIGGLPIQAPLLTPVVLLLNDMNIIWQGNCVGQQYP
jgi:hypothetical protein